MPVTYRKADVATMRVIDSVMKKYHGGKADAETTVQCLMAYPPQDEEGEATGPALTHDGYAALATIRQTNLKQRAAGFADLEILLDNDNWTISTATRNRNDSD